MVRILCGPVVGHVTSSSAIILLELDATISVTGILEKRNSKNKATAEKQFEARRPAVFEFQGLTENTKYTFYANGISDKVLAEFSTFPENITRMNIAVVSGDKAKSDVNVRMCDKLKSRVSKEPIHLVLHIGDNVHLDENLQFETNDDIVNSDNLFDSTRIDQSIPYVKARSLLRNKPKDKWALWTDEILEIYREKYREVWNLPNRSYILSHTSNLMILDDHEIRKDIGELKPDDTDPESKEHFLASLALQVYHEYQRQLWDPQAPIKDHDLTSEFTVIEYGNIGIMMLDARTPNSVYKSMREPEDLSYYGTDQVRALRQCFRNVNVNLWLMVSTLPLMFQKQKVDKLSGSLAANDHFDFINKHHDKDLLPILEDIQKFKKRKAAKGISGDVLILSGGNQMGGFADIYYEGRKLTELVCRQVCIGPLQDKQIRPTDFDRVSTMLRFTDRQGDFSYSHFDWTCKCNFAVLKIEDKIKSLPYRVQLVAEDGTTAKHSETEYWCAETDSTPSFCGCCFCF